MATEDTEYTITAGQLPAGYSDADSDQLNVLALSSESGTIKAGSNGTFIFTPNLDTNGEVKLNYIIRDGKGGNTVANATFTIDAVNDAPVISDTGKPESLFGTISEDSTAGFTVQLNELLQQYSDVDQGDTLEYQRIQHSETTIPTAQFT